MKDLEYLLKLDENELKNELYEYLINMKMNPQKEDGFIYVKGDIPVLLVAHMDTVCLSTPTNIIYQQELDKIYNPDGILGGDDRCGIYIILELLKKYRPYVLFTEDEEKECIGAKKAVNKISIPDVKYIIEFDRRGQNDCVFYECDNKEFINYIESFGFKTNYGTYSDILFLGKAWNIATVNLSVGYYNEHTKDEYIVFHEVIETLKKASNMLDEIENASYYSYH